MEKIEKISKQFTHPTEGHVTTVRHIATRYDGENTEELVMTKADLISELEKQCNVPHKIAEQAVNVTFDTMVDALFNDDRIEIRGFGSFANRSYKAYEGRNPKTGKIVKVTQKKVPFFKVGKELKEMVDAGKKTYVIRDA